MPEIGKAFYETGRPIRHQRGLKVISTPRSSPAFSKVEDTEVAAAQFLDSCQAMLFKPVLFNFAPPPKPERVKHVVDIAVRTFMAAYSKQ